MADLNIAEKLVAENDLIESSSVFTGDQNHSRQLYYQLLQGIRRAKKIDIIVAFLMESGVKMLLKELKAAQERGVEIRILTGNYLGITQPSALYLIRRELGKNIQLRFYNDPTRSFHPKAYMLHYDGYSDIFIGSSNISRSALTSGIEWNYRFSNINDAESFDAYFRTFEDLFYNHAIIIDDEQLERYSKGWHRPAAAAVLDTYDDAENQDTKVSVMYEPRGAQIEALCALENSRAEGAKKGLVMAATGVGKTYIAAFDSQKYERVLFVAHREEILKQAALSFKNVRHSENYGFFNGEIKETGKSVIFASVATLGREEYLSSKYFAPDYFQYIVVDEFHHAVTKQYKKIIDYFKPEFLLGLTATPDRMDGRSIYEICDYNVPYEITLKEAINKGMLVPFHFYGIYDQTDYSGLHLVHGTYDEKELTDIYARNGYRHDLIYKHYCKYGSKYALGFCCSRAHAEEMAGEFCKRGIPSVAVYSNATGQYSMDRAEAISKLKKGEIRVIFSVDMFNEGVDIVDIDLVMFLRPTESPIVFLQQLGRGLRKCHGKDYLNVLDFIGNYEKAGNIRNFLLGNENRTGNHYRPTGNIEYPDDCIVDFDMQVIDLFAEMDKKSLRLKDQIRNEFYRIKELVGQRPTRMDMFTYMDDGIYQMALSHSAENPFRQFFDYLHDLGELTPAETDLYNSIGREFITYLEQTSMSKVYKMPVLNAFYNNGNVRTELTDNDLLESWKEFFNTGTNWRDLETAGTYDSYLAMTDKTHLKKIKQMPIKFLMKSGGAYFISSENHPIALIPELYQIVKQKEFADQMHDIIQYRTMNYYQQRYSNK